MTVTDFYLLLNRLQEDFPIYDEYSQLVDDAAKPQAKTSVPEDAIKISQNVKTGEFGIETGKQVKPEILESFTKHLQQRTADQGAKDSENNVESEMTEKQKNAEAKAKKAQKENAEQDQKGKEKVEEAKKEAKKKEDAGKEKVAEKEKILADLEKKIKDQTAKNQEVKDKAADTKMKAQKQVMEAQKKMIQAEEVAEAQAPAPPG